MSKTGKQVTGTRTIRDSTTQHHSVNPRIKLQLPLNAASPHTRGGGGLRGEHAGVKPDKPRARAHYLAFPLVTAANTPLLGSSVRASLAGGGTPKSSSVPNGPLFKTDLWVRQS